ncbi:MAG: CheR family methyltransferase [Thermodesulfobacteriota bacterium]
MEFDEFLREAAPLLGLQWRPFKRRGIRRKIERRIIEMGLLSFQEYLEKVKKESAEQGVLSKILTVTISRFFRDKEVFDKLGRCVLPIVLEKENKREVKIWCVGCASGEEPYTLALLWREEFEPIWPEVRVSILATDIGENLLKRAKEGRYKKSSLREVPDGILCKFFRKEGQFYILNHAIRESIELKEHDVLHEEPFLGMDMVLCRNLAFTYFSKESQKEFLKKMATSLKEKCFLVIGKEENLPLTYPTLFVPIFPNEKIYEKYT